MAANLELVIKGIDNASGALGAVSKSSEGLSSKLGALAAVAGGVVAGFASFKTLSSAVDKTQELGSAVSRLTRETGMTAEESSRMLFAFRRVGLSADDASRNLGIFAKQLAGVEDFESGVAKGGKKVADSLKEIGVKVTDVTGKIRPISEIMPELADQFKRMPAGVDKTALAMQLFGRSGKDMIPLLNLGAEGLEEMAKQADKLGVTLTGKNVEDIKKYGRAQKDFGEAINGVKIMIGVALMPVLTQMTQWFVAAMPHIRSVIDVFIDLAKYIAFTVKSGDDANDWLTHLPGFLQPVAEIIGEVTVLVRQLAIDGFNVLKDALVTIVQSSAFKGFLDGIKEGLTNVRDIAVDAKDTLIKAFQEIDDAIGKVPGLDKLTEGLGDASKDTEGAKNLGKGLTEAAAGILAVAVAAGVLDAASGVVANSIAAMSGAVTAIAIIPNPILLIAVALAVVVAGCILLEEKTQFFSKEVLPVLKEIGDWIETKVVPALQKFADTEVIPRLKEFGAWVKSDMIPTLKKFADTELIPRLKEFGKWLKSELFPVLQHAAQIFKDDWLPVIKDAAAGVTKFLLPALDTLHDLWVNAIEPALTQGVIPALEWLEDIISKIVDWFSRHETATKALVAVIAGLAIGILLLLNPWLLVVAAIVVVLAKWDEISKMFTETIPNAIGSVIKKIEELPIIGEIFKATWDLVKVYVETAWNNIKIIIETGIDIIRDIINIAMALLKGDWSAAWDGVKQLVSDIWDGIKALIGNNLDAVKDIVEIGFNLVKGIVGDIWREIQNTVITALNGLLSVVEGGINLVVGAVRGLFEDIKAAADAFPGPNPLGNAMQSAIDKMSDVTLGRIPKVKDEGDLLGRSAVDGVIAGMDARTPDMILRAQRAAAGVTGEFKRIWDIQSPSRVMVKMGRQLTQGLNIGMGQMASPRFALSAATVGGRSTVINVNSPLVHVTGSPSAADQQRIELAIAAGLRRAQRGVA